MVSVSPLLLKPWSRSSAAGWVQPSRVVWTVGFSGEREGGKHLHPSWGRHREGAGPDPAMQGGHGHLGCSLPQPGSRRGEGSGWQCFSPDGLIRTLDLAQRAPHLSYHIYPAQKHLTGSAPKATCSVAQGPCTTAPCLLSPALQPPVLHGRLVVGRVLLADTQHLDGVGTWPLCPLPTPGAAGGGGLVGRGSEAGGCPWGVCFTPAAPFWSWRGAVGRRGCLESSIMVLSCPTSHFPRAHLKLSSPHRGGDGSRPPWTPSRPQFPEAQQTRGTT